MLKKYLISFLISVILFSFEGCYVYKSNLRPYNQAPSIWVCEEAKMRIVIPEGNKEDGSILEPVCTIELEETLDCDVLFSHGLDIDFTIDDYVILYGKCTYEKDYFIVEVKKDNIFNGKYDELIFRRRQGDGSPVS